MHVMELLCAAGYELFKAYCIANQEPAFGFYDEVGEIRLAEVFSSGTPLSTCLLLSAGIGIGAVDCSLVARNVADIRLIFVELATTSDADKPANGRKAGPRLSPP